MNFTRKDTYTNDHGETIYMGETENGDIYFKHDDWKNEFIKFDDIVRILNSNNYEIIKLAVILNSKEKNFVCSFLMDTKYKYLIPHIMLQTPYS